MSKSMNKTKNKTIILGSGGHCNVLIDILLLRKIEVIGIIDKKRDEKCLFDHIPVIREEDLLNDMSTRSMPLVNAVGQMPGNSSRSDLSKAYRDLGYQFLSVIHPGAIIARETNFSEGVQVMAGAVIQPNVIIGEDTIINTSASIDHDCAIGDSCHLAPGTVISGNVSIGSNTFVGAGSTIINNIRIGKNSTIAAGSIVFDDIAESSNFIQKR